MDQKVIVEIFKPNSLGSLICHGVMDTETLLISPETSDVIHFRRAVSDGKKVRVYDAKTGTPLYDGTLQAEGVSDFHLVNPIHIIGVSVLVKPGEDFLRDKIYIHLQPGTVIPAGTMISITGAFYFPKVYSTLTPIGENTTVVEVEIVKGIIIPIEPYEVQNSDTIKL